MSFCFSIDFVSRKTWENLKLGSHACIIDKFNEVTVFLLLAWVYVHVSKYLKIFEDLYTYASFS